jgi:hypothetical protein
VVPEEEVDNSGGREYVDDPSNYHPRFLSGRYLKIEQYEDDFYYSIVLDHFKRNLSSSRALIVVGYSFSDEKINELISTHFLGELGRPMVVIDVYRPDTPLLLRQQSHYEPGGVEAFNLSSVLETIIPALDG